MELKKELQDKIYDALEPLICFFDLLDDSQRSKDDSGVEWCHVGIVGRALMEKAQGDLDIKIGELIDGYLAKQKKVSDIKKAA